MTIIATRYLNETETPIPVVAGPATVAWNSGGFGQLPGVLNYGGTLYDCTQNGLISFHNTATGITENRPMWLGVGASGQALIDAIYGWVSAICWMHIHGTGDEGNTGLGLANWMKLHSARLRCGYITDFMSYIMPQVGVSTQRIQWLTTGPLNGYDDGHICPQLYFGGKWRMFDMSNGRYFTDSNGVHLSAAEILSLGIQNCTHVRIDADRDHSPSPAGNICYGWYWRNQRKQPSDLLAWYQRIFQSQYAF